MHPELVKLRQYIKENLAQGYTKEQIIQSLREAGWPEKVIQAGFAVRRSTDSPRLSDQNVDRPPSPAVSAKPTKAPKTSKAAKPKKPKRVKKPFNKKLILLPMGLAIIGLISVVAYFVVPKMLAKPAFGQLEMTAPADFLVLKPNNWQPTQAEEKETYIFAPAGAEKSMNEMIIAGYALGEDFKLLPQEKRDELIGQLKKSAKPDNFLQSGLIKDCKNPNFPAFEEIEYKDTFIALKSVGNCQMDGIDKTVATVLVILKSGQTTGLAVTMDRGAYEKSKAEVDKILMSLSDK